jgi:hypothetical protein
MAAQIKSRPRISPPFLRAVRVIVPAATHLMNRRLDLLFRYRIPVYLWAIIIVLFSILPVQVSPQKFIFLFIEIPHIDIIGHFMVYMVLGLLMARALRGHYQDLSWPKIIIFSFLICTVFGIINELCQYFIPTRVLEYPDMIANAAGALAGCLFFERIKRLKIWQR